MSSFFWTGTLQNLIRYISSIFFHRAPLGQETRKQVQSVTQRALSVTAEDRHEVFLEVAAILHASFLGMESQTLAKHAAFLSTALLGQATFFIVISVTHVVFTNAA